MNRTSLPAALLAAALLPHPGLGQSTGNAGFALDLPASTRALALGNAFPLADRDQDVLFYNPAFLSRSAGTGASVQQYRAAGTLGTLAAVTDWGSGGLAVGMQVLTYGAPSSDPAAVSADEALLLRSGPVGATEAVVAVGYGRQVLGIRAGLAVKGLVQRMGQSRGATGAVDLGLGKDVGAFSLGISAQHLGPGVEVDTLTRPLPRKVTAAAALRRRPVGPFDIGAAAAVARQRDGEIVPSGGVEIAWWPVSGRTLAGRVGLRRIPSGGGSPVTFGAAFTGDRITIEYAFQEFDGEGAAHRVGLAWR